MSELPPNPPPLLLPPDPPKLLPLPLLLPPDPPKLLPLPLLPLPALPPLPDPDVLRESGLLVLLSLSAMVSSFVGRLQTHVACP